MAFAWQGPMHRITPVLARLLVALCVTGPTGCTAPVGDTVGGESAQQNIYGDEWWLGQCGSGVELDDVRFCVDHTADGNYDALCDMEPSEYSERLACSLKKCMDWYGEGCVRAYMGSPEFQQKFPSFAFALVPVAPGQTAEQAVTDWAAQGATTEPLVTETDRSPLEQIAQRWRVRLVAIGIAAGAFLFVLAGKLIQGIASAGRTIAGFGIVIIPFAPCVQELVSDYDVFTAIQLCADGGAPHPADRL